MKSKKSVPLFMFAILMLSIFIDIISIYALSKTSNDFLYYLFLVSCSVTAHFIIMFISAPIVTIAFKKNFNYNSFWFAPKKFEKGLYDFLKVKSWKTLFPSYNDNEYSPKIHSYKEIIMNMCHAETVHWVILFASYIPLIFYKIIDKHVLLIITCVFFSFCHLPFIIIQRYNRPRVIKLNNRHKNKTE